MAHGFSAWVHLVERPNVDFYNTTAAQLIGNITISTSDIFVIPEILEWALRQFKPIPIRKFLFCQGHGLLPPVDDPDDACGEWGVDGVIASSVAIRDYLRDSFGLLDVPLLPCAIDPIFAPAAHKKRQIAYMPRKLPEDAAVIEASFKRRYPHLAAVNWVPIDNVPRAEVARVLGESDVFLSLGYRESFGLPPLEAMASGCLVAGYHAEGGREYITDANGWWADEGDRQTCVDGLAAAFDLLDHSGERLLNCRRAMAQTVARYSPQIMEAALVDFWSHQLQS